MDLTSAALSLLAVLLIVLGLKSIAESGLQTIPISYLLVGILMAYLFIHRQKKLKDPLIDLHLFNNKKFNSLMATNFFTMFVVFGTFIFTAQYMQLIMGLSPLKAGLWSMTFSAGFIISSLLCPIIVRFIRPAFVMAAGLILGATGFVFVSQVNGVTDIMQLGWGTFLFSLGSSPVLLFTTGMLINSAPPEKAGAAAAISETSNELGGALGIAVLGSLGTYLYHKKLFQSPLASTDSGLQTALLGTLENAIRYVENKSSSLLELVHTSYIQSFEVVMLVSCSVLLSIAVLVVIQLRDVKLEDEA